MHLAFVLLDLEYAKIKSGAKCMRQSVDMHQFREAGRTGTIYSMESIKLWIQLCVSCFLK